MRLSLTLAALLLLTVACSVVRSAAMHEADPGSLSYLGGVVIPRDGEVGGLSGLVVAADGRSFTAINDLGYFFTGRLVYDKAGRLTDAVDIVRRRLGGVRSNVKKAADAEALSPTLDGGWLVSFEGDHRIMAYPADLGAVPRRLALPDEVARLPVNGGLEAVAMLPDGSIVAIVEAPEAQDEALHRGWVGREGAWRPFRYRTDELYAPSDAAALPNGDVLILERHASLLMGFRTRLMLVTAAQLRTDAVVAGLPVGDVAPPIGSDNFEGLAVRTGPDGAIYLYIVSDDNFFALQRTILVHYALRLPPSPPSH